MPMQVAIKYARAPDGRRFFYQHWIPDRPRAALLFVHGIGDHIGRYGRLTARSAEAGFAAALYDQRGHGRSDGRRGHIESVAALVDDLAHFVDFTRGQLPEGTPLFLVGAGLGALVAVRYELLHAAPLAGLVGLSAAVQPYAPPSARRLRLLRRAGGLLSALPLVEVASPESFMRDDDGQQQLAEDRLRCRRITVGTALEIERAAELAMGLPARVHAPALFLAGSADRLVDPEGTRRFTVRLASTDKEYRIYEGMGHDLLHDVEGEAVLDALLAWIGDRAAQPVAEDQLALNGGETVWQDVSQHSR